MPVTVYSSADAGSPGQIANAAGTLIAILDACLVNGYGSKAAAGWTKPYATSTTVAAYKQGAGTKNRLLRVDDTQASYARLVGYEAMTDINTGTGPFPTDVQVGGGDYLHKHNGAAGTRPWFLVADAKSFYFWTQWDTTNTGLNAGMTFFGEIRSLKAADDYAVMLMAADGVTKNSSISASNDVAGAFSGVQYTLRGHYMPRSYIQTGGSIGVGKRADSLRISNGAFLNLNSYGYAWLSDLFNTPFPSPVDGAVNIAPMVVHEAANSVDRGFMPGCWQVTHARGGAMPGDTFSANAGVHAGKTFIMLPFYAGFFAIETSNTWWPA